MKATVVLVHGAFADSASWDGVIRRLHDAGHDAIAAVSQPDATARLIVEAAATVPTAA